MKIDFTLFAGHAIVREDGTFDVLHGGYDRLTSASFPSVCTDLSLLARFVFEPNECGREYVCVVKVTAPDGNVLQPDLHVKMRVLVNELHPEKPNTLTGMFRYDGLLTAMPGVYRFSFFFGDFSPGHAEIEVVERAKP